MHKDAARLRRRGRQIRTLDRYAASQSSPCRCCAPAACCQSPHQIDRRNNTARPASNPNHTSSLTRSTRAQTHEEGSDRLTRRRSCHKRICPNHARMSKVGYGHGRRLRTFSAKHEFGSFKHGSRAGEHRQHHNGHRERMQQPHAFCGSEMSFVVAGKDDSAYQKQMARARRRCRSAQWHCASALNPSTRCRDSPRCCPFI